MSFDRVWILAPALVYGGSLLYRAARHRLPTRARLNAESSLLLLFYLVGTAALGVFWVANQELPPFDLHYLFGYVTVCLVALHLTFNLRTAWRTLGSRRRSASEPGAWRRAAPWMLFAIALLASFLLGMRHGKTELVLAGSDDVPEASAPVTAVKRYHEFSAHSRAGVFARAPAATFGPRPGPFKSYDGAPPIALGSPDAKGRPLSTTLREVKRERAALTRDTLGTLLFHTAGVTARRGGFALRAAPSGGGLFSAEVYVLVRRARGIPPGIYHYNAGDHTLQPLPGNLPDAKRPSQLGFALGRDTPMAVFVSSVFLRTAYKYRDRAYRYVAADVGHLIENLRLAASELGFFANPLSSFDERRVDESLGLDENHESTLAVIPVSATPPGPPSVRYAPRPLDAKPTRRLGVTAVVHRATSYVAPPLTGSAATAPAEPGRRVQLPDPAPAALPTFASIATRRSVRRFGSGPLRLVELSSVLGDAFEPRPLLSRAVDLHLVAVRVAGLQPGIYEYLPEDHALLRLRAGNFSDRAQSVALSQEVIGGAASVLVFSTSPDRALVAGARGYRHVFLETGARGERALLSAAARGLAACPVGAFYDDEAAELVGASFAERWVLHFVALGRP